MATPRRWGAFRRAKRSTRPDYKHRLAHKAALAQQPSTADTSFWPAEQVQALAADAETTRTAFQSVAVAVLQQLDEIAVREQRAAEATISLAQRDKLEQMIGEVEATRQAVGQMLSPSGVAMFGQGRPEQAEKALEPLWWFALCEALHALGDSIEAMASMATGQPQNSAPRILVDIVIQLLERHYQALFVEAEQWLD